jgi:hypothetical protein
MDERKGQENDAFREREEREIMERLNRGNVGTIRSGTDKHSHRDSIYIL